MGAIEVVDALALGGIGGELHGDSFSYDVGEPRPEGPPGRPNRPYRARRARSRSRTPGHSSAVTEYITVSRTVPSWRR